MILPKRQLSVSSTEWNKGESILHLLPSTKKKSRNEKCHWDDETTTRAKKFVLGFFVSITLSSGIWIPCQAFPLLATLHDKDNPSITGSYGSPVGSNPYFNSASAARLFVDPISSTSTSSSSPQVRRQMVQQGIRQDERLEQCFDKGTEWESCFWYGAGTAGNAAAPMTLPNFNTEASMAIKRLPTTKSNIPTW